MNCLVHEAEVVNTSCCIVLAKDQALSSNIDLGSDLDTSSSACDFQSVI